MAAKGGWVGGVIELEVGVSRCKLLYMEWTNNKVLLCITGNYTQYPVINYHGGKKNTKKEYIKLSHCYKAEINTEL